MQKLFQVSPPLSGVVIPQTAQLDLAQLELDVLARWDMEMLCGNNMLWDDGSAPIVSDDPVSSALLLWHFVHRCPSSLLV